MSRIFTNDTARTMEGNKHYVESKKSRKSTNARQAKEYMNDQFNNRDMNETTRLIKDDKLPEREVISRREVTNEKKTSLEATKGRKLVVLGACMLLHFIAGGIAVALGVVYVDLIREFEAPSSQTTLIQSIFMGAVIASGVLVTGLIQKYGTGVPGIVAAFIAALAFFASSFAPNVPTLIVLIGVIGGITMGVNYLSAFITVSWMFREDRKTALGLLTMGWAFGQITFPYVSQYLLEAYRWNGSFIIMSGIILNCVPCGILMHKSRKYFLAVKPSASKLRNTVKSCLQDYLFILYLIASFLFAHMMPVEMWYVADVTVVRGFDRSIGAVLLSFLGIFGFVGRIVAAVLLKTFKKVQALVHTFYAIIFVGVGHFLVGYFKELWGLFLGVIVRAIAAGLSIAVMPGSQIELRGVERYPQTVAICNLIGGVAQILGGLVGGVTVDLTGGYEFIFTLAAVVFWVCGVLMMIVWLFIRRCKAKEEDNVESENKTNKRTNTEKEPLIVKYEHSS